jgi:hypothetical protein
MVNNLSEVLALSPAGSEALERCEQMYQSLWRSVPFSASDLDSESLAELDDDLRFKAASVQVGSKPADDDEWGQADWHERVEVAMQEVPSFIQPDTLLVTLRNYKGEGVGLALYDLSVEPLPLYISKAYSAEFFNA